MKEVGGALIGSGKSSIVLAGGAEGSGTSDYLPI